MKTITFIFSVVFMTMIVCPVMANEVPGLSEITEKDSLNPETIGASETRTENPEILSTLTAKADLAVASAIDGQTISLFSETELKSREMVEIYEKGISDARVFYTGHKSAGVSTLVSSSLVLPIGLISAVDHSSASFKETFDEIGDSSLKSNPAYMKGFTEEALKMRRKSVRKNLIIGAAVQAIIVTGVGSLMLNSNNKVGMSGF
jgi:hypothetical protein